MKYLTLTLLLLTFNFLQAQDDFYSFEEDIYTLSPFEISSSGYSQNRYDPRNRGGNQNTCPVRIVKRADAVTLKLTISSSAKKPDVRIESLQRAFTLLKEKAAEKNHVLVKTGYVELPLATSRRSFFTSAKTSEEVSSFDVTLITKMGENDTVFDRTAVLNDFIDEIDFGKHTLVYYVNSGIALLEADSFRPEIIKMIGEEYQLMKETFGKTLQVNITGIDRRVQVRQLNATSIEVYIPYTMNLRTNSEKG